MTTPVKYAHVGYPKAASTWLQFFLFPCHPDIVHLGRHTGDEIVDDDVRIALWNDLITRPLFLYDPGEVRRTFEKHFDRAVQAKARACGISQEVLTLSMIGTLDIAERARRLRDAMGEDTRIVIVIRSQLDWIRSLFGTCLSEGGSPLGWDDFLFYFYYQQDQSPFYTLFYDDVFDVYAELFGRSNVHVIPFELIKTGSKAFADKVCEAIGVPPLTDLKEQPINERMSAKALTACLNNNRNASFYFGSNYFRRPMGFAAAPIFRTRFGIEPPTWMAEERMKSTATMQNMEAAVQQLERQGVQIPALDTTFPARYVELLTKAYAPHNARLMSLAGLDLAELGYPL